MPPRCINTEQPDGSRVSVSASERWIPSPGRCTTRYRLARHPVVLDRDPKDSLALFPSDYLGSQCFESWSWAHRIGSMLRPYRASVQRIAHVIRYAVSPVKCPGGRVVGQAANLGAKRGSPQRDPPPIPPGPWSRMSGSTRTLRAQPASPNLQWLLAQSTPQAPPFDFPLTFSPRPASQTTQSRTLRLAVQIFFRLPPSRQLPVASPRLTGVRLQIPPRCLSSRMLSPTTR